MSGPLASSGAPDGSYLQQRHRAGVLAVLPFLRGATVLDLGPPDRYRRHLLATTANYLLALAPPAAVELSGEDQTRPPRVTARAERTRLPLADASVDAVALLGAPHPVSDLELTLAEAARVLRPAGTLVLNLPTESLLVRCGPGGHSLTGLDRVLGPRFAPARVWGVHHGRRLRRLEARRGSLPALLGVPPPQGSPVVGTHPRTGPRTLDAPAGGHAAAPLLAGRPGRRHLDPSDFEVAPDRAVQPLAVSLDVVVVAWRRA